MSLPPSLLPTGGSRLAQQRTEGGGEGMLVIQLKEEMFKVNHLCPFQTCA